MDIRESYDSAAAAHVADELVGRPLDRHLLSRLVEATPALREPRYAREVAAFFRRHPIPEAKRSVKQAREVFRLNTELRRRTAPGVGRWLEAHE